MPDSKKLFEIQIRVHPTAEHPRFEDIKFGILSFWLFALDVEQALAKAVSLARELPYKLGSAKVFPVDGADNLQPSQIHCAETARYIGMNLALRHWPKDMNEDEILGHYPFLVPPLT